MNWQNMVLGMTLAGLMAACGGGGGNDTSAFGSTSGNAAFGNGTKGGSTTTNPDVSTNASGTVLLSLSSSTTSASQPATVTAVVKDAAGIPISGALVQFTLSGGISPSTLASLSPATAITDANGQAVTTLTPQSGSTSGAAYVNATADTSAGSLTAKKAFTVSAINVSLNGVSVGQGTINGYDSTSVAIGVIGASSATPVTVNVTSTCASNGKASISPATLTITGSGGTVTYQDKGCGNTSGIGHATDRINVQIVGTSQQGYQDLDVNAPTTQGLQFVSVDHPIICQKGTGCASVANVTFKAVDQTGTAQPGVPVTFALNNSAASLVSSSGVTAADGTVTVAVTAKNTPSPVRVIASATNNLSLQTVSNTLTISGGLPVAAKNDVHNGISFASTKYNLDYYLDGDFAQLTLRLTDRYGAPAVDGTVVNLVSDGGTLVPAYCVTKDGTGECTSKLVVSNPRPKNGRVHVVAYANGQEYYIDANRNGVRDSGEVYVTEIPPTDVCLDINEDRICQESEYLVGEVSTPPSLYLTGDNNRWDDAGTAYARKDAVFTFSNSRATPRLYQVANGACSYDVVDDTYMTVTLSGKANDSRVVFCIRDDNTDADTYGGNPLPNGIVISSNPNIPNATVSIGNSPTPVLANGPTFHRITVTNLLASSGTPLSNGTATITFMMPAGPITMDQQIIIRP